MPLMPMPPIPTKWMGPISRGNLIWFPSLVFVTPGHVPGIHVFCSLRHARAWPGNPRLASLQVMKDVDGRDKPGHDGKIGELAILTPSFRGDVSGSAQGAARWRRTRNLDVKGTVRNTSGFRAEEARPGMTEL
jgi:hypothetical protein